MASNEDAARNRILSHMNKDHAYDTKLYLIHRLSYPKTLLLPSNTATVLLSDIQTTHLTVSIDGKPKEIPFNPPMNSLSDSRVRLVEMTRQAETALGVDRDMVSIELVWLPPKSPLDWTVIFILIPAVYILFVPSTVQPGGLLYSTVLKDYPDVAEWMYRQAGWGYWVYVVVHALETVWFSWRVLAKYWQVPGISLGVAALWTLDVMTHGFYAMQKWDKMVEMQKKSKGKKEH
ncbi:hypothetical protein ABW20_dc0101082 [Dactylellina cionopaga]|nr:hypothetical protein ABW20_dc0101082 [Dactylellina cionopaga]